ncbi:hypothetical protein E2C01_091016 [Portunus trituberculatus]|uniref:Uncharacterized protein n=1 Tax=Portunus trituberculatus TaxID=210409 RepID=A0A5B7JG99_PORTR|nr:hypothetical protein [Portunus trituberculatus]
MTLTPCGIPFLLLRSAPCREVDGEGGGVSGEGGDQVEVDGRGLYRVHPSGNRSQVDDKRRASHQRGGRT